MPRFPMMIKPTIKMSQIMIRFSFSIVGSYRCLGVQKHLLIQPPCGVESKKESLQVAYRVIIGAEDKQKRELPGNLFGSKRAVHDLDNVRRFDVSRDRAKQQQQDSGMRRRNAADHEQHLEQLISGHGELTDIPP